MDSVVLNEYELDMSGLSILELDDNDRWLLMVACHRSSFSKRKKYIWLLLAKWRISSNWALYVY